MTIDLHGYTSDEATSKILSALLSFDSYKHEYELEIITGKGMGVMLTTTINILEDQKRQYEVLEGRVIVYKNDDLESEDIDWTSLLNEVMEED